MEKDMYGSGNIFFYRNASLFVYQSLFHCCCELNLIKFYRYLWFVLYIEF